LQFRGYGFGGVPRTDITLSNNRPILIGAGGGTIDTNGSATSHGGSGGVANSGAFSGILSLGATGSGLLTKTGDGEFYHYGDANYGGVTITRGSWAIDGETQLGGTASPFNVTLDNGANAAPGTQPATLRIVQSNVTLLAAHMLTIGSGGGTICVDNSLTWKGSLVGGGTLTKGGYTGAVASPLIGNSAGAGTLVLSSDSAGFSGNILVNAGSLIAANSGGSATGAGAVTVASGATLGGTGNCAGTVTVNTGAHLAPGSSSTGTLSVGRLNLLSNALLDYELANPGASDLTSISSTGGLSLDGGVVNIIALPGFGVGEYPILDYTTSFTGSAANLAIGSAPSGFVYSFINNATTTSINLVVAVPEPSTWIFALMAIPLFTRLRRRTRSDEYVRPALCC
jgi:autotransporter-associated beta strand protein